MKLGSVLTVSQVAALAGWSRRRMLRHLQRLDDGSLLVNVGTEARPLWTTTLGALQRIAPAWFVDEDSFDARLAACEEKVGELEGVLVRALKVNSAA